GEFCFGGQLREGGRLVIAPFRKTCERLFAEHVDAAADPAVDRAALREARDALVLEDRKSTRLNSSHVEISYAVFCLKKKKTNHKQTDPTQPHQNRKKKLSYKNT